MSSKRNDGGPAFPRPAFAPDDVGYEDCGITEEQDGMTLRDYFAAHAPPVPYWFEPNMPGKPKLSSAKDYPFSKAAMEAIRDWVHDPCYDVEEAAGFTPADVETLARFKTNQKEEIAARVKWNLTRELQKSVQWRWQYADAMLAERDKGA